jgi:hypothetical protein
MYTFKGEHGFTIKVKCTAEQRDFLQQNIHCADGHPTISGAYRFGFKDGRQSDWFLASMRLTFEQVAPEALTTAMKIDASDRRVPFLSLDGKFDMDRWRRLAGDPDEKLSLELATNLRNALTKFIDWRAANH